MALPKIDVPIYEVEVPSLKKRIRFRPFTVKEEKLFLMAAQSEDPDSIVKTIVQVLNNCVLDEMEIEKMPMFDLEFLFLNLRARSIGEVVELSYKCNNEIVDDGGNKKSCNNIVNVDVNLLEIKPSETELKNKISLTDKLGIAMKYPNLDLIKNSKSEDELDMVIELIVDCIDYIYDEENIYYAKDSTREELLEFLDSLQSKELEKIKLFFESLPKITKEIDFSCNKCGYHEKITLEGIQNFFV
jgi:rubrerythrin